MEVWPCQPPRSHAADATPGSGGRLFCSDNPRVKALPAGAGAALLWVLFAVRWFDPARPWRPGWLAAIPPSWLALPGVGLLAAWCWQRRRDLSGPPLGPDRPGLLLAVGLALLFRLPLAWQGS